MKIYLDTSVLIVYLFGKEKEPERFKAVSNLFDRANNREFQVAISLYSFQEISEYIKDTFPLSLSTETFRLSLLLLLRNRLEILSRP